MVQALKIDNTIRIVLAAFFMLIAVAWVASPAKASSTAEAEAFIQNLANDGVAMLQNASYSNTEREAKFRGLVREGFALDVIGRFVVGRYWRKMDKDLQAEYQEMFGEWVLSTYSNRLAGYEGQKIEVIKSQELNNKAKDVVVRTRIVSTDGQPEIIADWRVRNFKGDLKIIDIIVEGVSMVAAQKSEFEAVIRKDGVDGLVESLRTRLATTVASGG